MKPDLTLSVLRADFKFLEAWGQVLHLTFHLGVSHTGNTHLLSIHCVLNSH